MCLSLVLQDGEVQGAGQTQLLHLMCSIYIFSLEDDIGLLYFCFYLYDTNKHCLKVIRLTFIIIIWNKVCSLPFYVFFHVKYEILQFFL